MISPCYPTRDHLQPWRLFALLALGLVHQVAAERRLMTGAIGDAFSDDLIARRELDELAFPETGPPIKPDELFKKE